MKLRYLHLSDLHLSANLGLNQGVVTRSLLDALGKLGINNKPLDFIVITGDVAFAGNMADYEVAKTFCGDLLKVTGLSRERLYLVPGNHDINRDAVSPVDCMAWKNFENQDDITIALEDKNHFRKLMHKFADFNRFAEQVTGKCRFSEEDYYFVEPLHLSKEGQTVHIELLGLNSALFAGYDGDDQQKLALGLTQVDSALQRMDKQTALCIGFFHHPFECFLQHDKVCRNRLINKLDLLLTGHLHKPDNVYNHDPAGRCLSISAGAGFETRESHNSFNIVDIDLHTGQGQVQFFKYISGHNSWVKYTEANPHDQDGVFPFEITRIKQVAREPDNIQRKNQNDENEVLGKASYFKDASHTTAHPDPEKRAFMAKDSLLPYQVDREPHLCCLDKHIHAHQDSIGTPLLCISHGCREDRADKFVDSLMRDIQLREHCAPALIHFNCSDFKTEADFHEQIQYNLAKRLLKRWAEKEELATVLAQQQKTVLLLTDLNTQDWQNAPHGLDIFRSFATFWLDWPDSISQTNLLLVCLNFYYVETKPKLWQRFFHKSNEPDINAQIETVLNTFDMDCGIVLPRFCRITKRHVESWIDERASKMCDAYRLHTHFLPQLFKQEAESFPMENIAGQLKNILQECVRQNK
ncbi:MAG: metallophosphoesterase [Gammaproteobacteria bacterium]|nr:metallophosphoesterase [Gammaproteobacteria bacterium]